ncbi:hypothetical protein ACI2OX_20340 [Bacillus sp. N9]
MKEQAVKGVKVRLLLDWLGSRSVPSEWIKEARNVGIHIAYCHKPRLPFLIFHCNSATIGKLRLSTAKLVI